MKTDLTLNQLEHRVQSLQAQSKDYLAPASSIKLNVAHGQPYIDFGQNKLFALSPVATRQLATICDIPQNYLTRLIENHGSLAEETVDILACDVDKAKLFRTTGRNCTAILSDHHKKIDNMEVLQAVKNIMAKYPGLKLASASLSPELMYLKIMSRKTTLEIKPGDKIAVAAAITNSPVGLGALHTSGMSIRLVCGNGLALPSVENTTRKIHLGKQFYSIDEYNQYAPSVEEIQLQLEEQLLSALDPSNYTKLVEMLRLASEIRLASAPTDIISNVSKHLALTPAETASFLFWYMTNKESSLFGVIQALTRSAEDNASYARATLLERQAYDLLSDGIRAAENPNSADNILMITAS